MSKQPFIDQLDQAISQILANPDAAPAAVDSSVAELMRLARDLRDLPRPEFKSTLKTDLERKADMSTTALAFRPGFRTLTPYLLPANAEYVDFLKNVFGAVETERTETGPGRFHAEFRIGDSMLMLGVGSGMKMPMSLEIYVPNVDDMYQRAIDGGCKELMPLRDAHWEDGLRLACVEDQEGNVWSIATHFGKNYIPEGRDAMSAGFVVKGAARFTDFLKRAFDAEDLDGSSRLINRRLRKRGQESDHGARKADQDERALTLLEYPPEFQGAGFGHAVIIRALGV